MNVLEYQMQLMFEGLKTSEALVYGCALLLLALAALVFRSTRWGIIAVMMWVSTLGYAGWTGGNLAFPFQQLRGFNRGFCVAMLILLLIPAIRSSRGWRSHTILLGFWLIYAFEMVFSFRQFAGGDFTRGYFGTICFTLIFITFGFGLGRSLQSMDDVYSAIKAIVWGGALFTIGSAYQWVVDPSQAMWAGRFLGTSGNANHAAVILGGAIPAACYILIERLRRRGIRMWQAIIFGAVTAMMVVCVLWTGSRTGNLVALVGLVLLFRLKLGKLTIAVIICGVFVALILHVYEDAGILESAGRLLDLSNTNRVAPWARLYSEFLSSPLIGLNAADSMFSENSYLLIASRTGVMGLVPFFLGILTIMLALFRLHRMRRYLGEYAFASDVVTGGIISILIGGIFEGYLAAVFSFVMFVLFIYLAVLAFLLDYAKAMAIHQQQQAAAEWEEGRIDEMTVPADDYAEVPQ